MNQVQSSQAVFMGRGVLSILSIQSINANCEVCVCRVHRDDQCMDVTVTQI